MSLMSMHQFNEQPSYRIDKVKYHKLFSGFDIKHEYTFVIQ